MGDERHTPADVQSAGRLFRGVARLEQTARLGRRHVEHRLAEQRLRQFVGHGRARFGRAGASHALLPQLVPPRRPPRGRVDVRRRSSVSVLHNYDRDRFLNVIHYGCQWPMVKRLLDV